MMPFFQIASFNYAEPPMGFVVCGFIVAMVIMFTIPIMRFRHWWTGSLACGMGWGAVAFFVAIQGTGDGMVGVVAIFSSGLAAVLGLVVGAVLSLIGRWFT